MKKVQQSDKNNDFTMVPASVSIGNVIEIQNPNTLIENKILDYAIYKAEYKRTHYVADLELKELCTHAGTSYSSYNKAFRNIARKNKSYLVYDFELRLCDKIVYKNGHAKFVFTKEASKYMNELKEYVSYDIENMFLFKHVQTHMIYKLLFECGKTGFIYFDLGDLKRYLYPTEPDRYTAWGEFNRNVLVVAKRDLDTLSQDYSTLTFDYNPILEGKGGRVKGIQFSVYYNNAQKESVKTIKAKKNAAMAQDKEKVTYLNDILSSEYQISVPDMREILAIAKGDIDKIENAYVFSQKFTPVYGIKDWLMACIEFNWVETLSSNQKSEEKNYFFLIHNITLQELYLELFKRNFQWDRYMKKLSTTEITYSQFSAEDQILLTEIMAHVINAYLSCELDFPMIKNFAKKNNYEIDSIIKRIQTLKCCNQEYRQKFFSTYAVI